MKIFIVFVLIYPLGLLFSFVSEVTYKKKTISEVKNEATKIIRKASIIYFIFITASIVYHLAGIKFGD